MCKTEIVTVRFCDEHIQFINEIFKSITFGLELCLRCIEPTQRVWPPGSISNISTNNINKKQQQQNAIYF